MEKKVERLEAMKAESDVNYLSKKLDFEFENSEEMQANPAKMLQKLNDVKKEYSALLEEAAAVQKAQQEAVVEFQNNISTVCQLLMKLQSTTGLQEGERPEELDQIEQLLGIQLPTISEGSSGDKNSDSASSNNNSASSNNTIGKPDVQRDKPQ